MNLEQSNIDYSSGSRFREDVANAQWATLEKKYDANKDLTKVFPLFGYDASQTNIKNYYLLKYIVYCFFKIMQF